MHSKHLLSEEDVAAAERDLQLAIECHQANRLQEASQYYLSVLNKNPDHVVACLNLGALLLRCGAVEKGVGLLDKAATRAVAERNAETLFFIANSLNASGRFIEARTSYRQLLEIDPQHADGHCNLALALRDLGRVDEAIQHVRLALEIRPDHLEATTNLGIFLRDAQRFSEAEAVFRSAIERNPGESRFHYNLGTTLKKAGRLREAESSLRAALQINPDFSDACSYLGAVLFEIGNLDEAVACYRKVLALQPDSDMAHFSLGTALLSSGQYREGWQECEHRWLGSLGKFRYPTTSLPQWRGETPQPGDSILIFEEQGWGDRLQFSRYLHQLRALFSGGVSVVSNAILIHLMRRSYPDCEFLESIPQDQQRWQWQCPLMSLPLAFNTSVDTIPAAPYLIANPQRVAHFNNKIALEIGSDSLVGTKRKIGVVWKSSSAMINTGLRSLSFAQIATLFAMPDTVWFSLQKEPGSDEQLIQASGQLIDWKADLNDFDATAALIMNLDLVITVDTSVAHLAGALGKPVWLLNRHASEWRWMREREDSPWYPTMQIFTQDVAGEWSGVIARVGDAMRKMWR